MRNHNPIRRSAGRRRAFTLVELLVAVSILAMLAALSLSMLRNVAEYARVDRTRTQIARIDTYIMERYNSYLTRTVPIRPPTGTNPQQAAQLRLYAIRELMRLELPDHQSDIEYPGTLNNSRLRVLQSVPTIARAMRNKVAAMEAATGQTWTDTNEGAECLYLIVSTMQSNGRNVIDGFSASEVGNIDGDAVPELWDAWGIPIEWTRWPVGYLSDANENPADGSLVQGLPGTGPVATTQVLDSTLAPDPFDTSRVDPRWNPNNASPFMPFALKPLIVSCGQDRLLGLVSFDYDPSAPTVRKTYYQYDNYSDPYQKMPTCKRYLGVPSASGQSYQDNITNHYVETP